MAVVGLVHEELRTLVVAAVSEAVPRRPLLLTLGRSVPSVALLALIDQNTVSAIVAKLTYYCM